MAYQLNGTSQYFNTALAPVSSGPVTLAAWFLPSNVTTSGVLVGITDNADANSGHRFTISASGAATGDPIEAICQPGTVSAVVAKTTTGYTAGAWQHACGVFTSSTSRTAYLNAGSSGTDTQSATPTGLNQIKIGMRVNVTPGLFFDGLIAEVGIWNAALTAAEVASLADGMTCDKVRPQNLVFYAPLVRDLIDAKGGLTITNNNGATVANHPRVYA
jgi:hypothetical protein